MRKIYLKKTMLALSFLMMLTIVCFGQKKKIILVGADADNARAADSVLIDTLVQWVDVHYMGSAAFNEATYNQLYNPTTGIGAEGVIVSESIGSGSIFNFGRRDNYPVPSIVMEAAMFTDDVALETRWPLMATGGGTWGFATPEEVDLKWKIVWNFNYITEEYANYQVITYSTISPPTYGVPYLHDFNVPVTILAVGARESGGTSPADWDQSKAVAVGHLTSKDMLFMNIAHPYHGLDPADATKTVGTSDFFNLFKRSVKFIFNLIPSSVEKVQNDIFNLSVYPNPAESGMQVSFKAIDNQNARISLVNLAGQEVLNHSLKTLYGINRVELDVNPVASGIYLLKLEIGGQVTYTKISVK